VTVFSTGALGVGPGDVADLFARYGRPLHRYCAARVGQSAAEDVVSETFLVAHERWHTFDSGRGTVQSWLYGIATNLVHRRQRDEVRGFRALARTGTDPLVEESHAERVIARADASSLSRSVADALARLPARQRDVLLLFAVAELEYAEIAAALDIPLGSVQSALFRARTKIRSAMKEIHDGR
jgi:RNA polymerase sigma factor (sigma-70 family)